ncbi:MAG TPA: AraC family ligand binding domain-containing protein [Planctomycetota bacterium]|jgi:mannose-6-phosphate isomerase-like protein (cupin superfamily)|nr:AraC family ligand binding domain-containing protein [Planctomycetota bacterium]
MNKSQYAPFVRPMANWIPYTQPEPPGAAFVQVLNKDEVPDLALGRVTLTGPIHKTPATHTDCEQIYLILAGEGTIHLAGRQQAIDGPGVVVIPRHTLHSMEVAKGHTLTYYFINQYSGGS